MGFEWKPHTDTATVFFCNFQAYILGTPSTSLYTYKHISESPVRGFQLEFIG